MTDQRAPIAGWYPDPENPGAERWWNGSSWSDHRRTPDSAAVAAPAGQQSTPAVPPPIVEAQQPPADGLAIAGFVVSLAGIVIGWFTLALPGIVGAILSGVALHRIKQRERAGIPVGGRGLAIAGLVIGCVTTGLMLVGFVLYIVMLMFAFAAFR